MTKSTTTAASTDNDHATRSLDSILRKCMSKKAILSISSVFLLWLFYTMLSGTSIFVSVSHTPLSYPSCGFILKCSRIQLLLVLA